MRAINIEYRMQKKMEEVSNFIKYSFLTLFLLGCNMILPAQNIKLHFPHFAGVPYVYYLQYGDTNDTIAKGLIPDNGRLTLVISEKHKDYAGMSRWMLNGQQGGGLDLIVTGENYSVECLEAQPSEQSIIFTGNIENPYLMENYNLQQDLFQKIDAIRMAVKAYPVEDSLYPVFERELSSLEQQFEEHQAAIAKSPLWAAKFTRIVDNTRGIADKLYLTENEKAIASNRFITREMDWQALYNSGHWDQVIYTWIEMHIKVIQNDDTLVSGVRQILERIPGNDIYTDFAAKLAKYFIKWEKDDLLSELSGEIKQSGRLLHTNGLLEAYSGLQKGDKAPVPSGLDNPKKVFAGGAVLVFHEPDCGNCETALNLLIADYAKIKDAGIRLISLSAGTDSTLNEKSIEPFPWTDKICDFKGIAGENFKNYGVIGTPTIILVDKKGIIAGRYARMEVAEILEKLKP